MNSLFRIISNIFLFNFSAGANAGFDGTSKPGTVSGGAGAGLGLGSHFAQYGTYGQGHNQEYSPYYVSKPAARVAPVPIVARAPVAPVPVAQGVTYGPHPVNYAPVGNQVAPVSFVARAQPQGPAAPVPFVSRAQPQAPVAPHITYRPNVKYAVGNQPVFYPIYL